MRSVTRSSSRPRDVRRGPVTCSGQTEVEVSKYRLYKSPQGDIVRVKMGFSWQAFFVGSLSTLVRRGWLLAAVAVIYYAGETFFRLAAVPA